MKQKLILILSALFMSMGAWATDVKIANTSSGALPSVAGYGSFTDNVFTTSAGSGLAGLTISATSGLTLTENYVSAANYGYCFTMRTAAGSTVYTVTLTAPDGYVIKGYSIGGCANSSNNVHTLTSEDGTVSQVITSPPYQDNAPKYFTVSGLNAQSTYFTISTANGGNSLYCPYFTITLKSASEVDVTYELYESDGETLVSSTTVVQSKNSAVNVPKSMNGDLTYSYAVTGTIGTEDCTIKVVRTRRTVITDLNNLSNTKSYVINCNRGALSIYNNYLASPCKTALGVTGNKFAIISYDSKYYLYSIDDGKYVTYSNSNTAPLADAPNGISDAVAFGSASAENTFALLFDNSTSKYLNSSASYTYGIVINSWGGSGKWDDGNQYTIYEAEDFDPTDAYFLTVTYNLYESDGETLVRSVSKFQRHNSDINISSVFVSPYEADDYNYATSGTIGTSDCTITVTRTLKSDTYAPSLPSGRYLSVGSKATSMTAATSASDNDHWYLLTQTRGGESPLYDVATYTSTLFRAASSVTPASLHNTPISGNEQYLVRFIETGSGTGLYYIQFANGNYVAPDLKTAQTVNNAGTYAFYRVSSGTYATDYTFGWNKDSNTGKRVDNNGAGYSLSLWRDGTNDGSGANNVWTIYPVEFVSTVEIAYTLTDENGATYSGTYRAEWEDSETDEPTISGAYGATLSNKVFSNEGGYSLTANIAFEFPVSSNSENNPTAIKSALGNSLWYANDGKVIADNAANTTVYDVYADNYRWYIIPVFSEGTFTFKLYNVGAAKYIPNNPSTASNTATTLTADDASAGAFQYSHYSQGNGFFDVATSKFLTINTSGTAQNIWLWGDYGSGTHQGSVMSFPDLELINVATTFAALKNATKFDIPDGSTVMGPSEFAAPADINAAIDAAKDVEDNAAAKIAFIESTNGTKIQNYLNQVAKYGALATVNITMSKEYGTMILPCPCTRIDGLDIYSCNAAEGNVLTLTLVDDNYAYNTPYIIHAEVGSKYTIIGWDKGGTSTYEAGWLTGALNSTTDIPVGSYMLATNKNTKVQAFYQITGEGVKCAINKCYLTVPSSGSVKAFFFEDDDQVTAIEELFGGETEQGAIYNLAGQRLQKAQKGINIINGKKVLK